MDPHHPTGPRDEFLSEEDLDLQNLSEDELIQYWNLWLEQAQSSNELDKYTYNHGVFMLLETVVNPSLSKADPTNDPIT